jgi:hypothetical protein
VNTLYIQGIELANFLTTNVKTEFSHTGITRRKEAISVYANVGNIWVFHPYVAQKVTLRANWYDNFRTTRESTDVIHALWLESKVRVALVVLAPETDLGFASDVGILSPD